MNQTVRRNVPVGAREKCPMHPTRLHLRLLPYPDGHGVNQPHHLSLLRLLLELTIHLLDLSPSVKPLLALAMSSTMTRIVLPVQCPVPAYASPATTMAVGKISLHHPLQPLLSLPGTSRQSSPRHHVAAAEIDNHLGQDRMQSRCRSRRINKAADPGPHETSGRSSNPRSQSRARRGSACSASNCMQRTRTPNRKSLPPQPAVASTANICMRTTSTRGSRAATS
ncbi:hypothetical protein B0H16DRAFT_520799 [Mycena metata]|uniref:Uncharacterized protein n=1 Tax=Mycena metata TaxID=1033252 RepID=A0AAD7H8W0_9AGAR|nr:hypothetical protein B0H16DRAFT_520799 [Mycena metata]